MSFGVLVWRVTAVLAIAIFGVIQVAQSSQDNRFNGGYITIDTRQAEIARRMTDGAACGRLTALESEYLQADFARIAKMEAEFRKSKSYISPAEAAIVHRELDVLSARMKTELKDSDVDKGDINLMQRRLLQRISDGVSTGTLSFTDGVILRRDFDKIAKLKEQLVVTGGGLDESEKSKISDDLHKLAKNLRGTIRDSHFAYRQPATR